MLTQLPIQRAKSLLLPLYYYTSLALRRSWTSAMCLAGCGPIPIVFYHRVADDKPNPWTISRLHFREQIHWLSNRFEFISLSEAQLRLRRRAVNRPAVCITFDDGYAENCDFALPLLVDHKIPFTYFVASDFVIHGKPFPHDVARGEPLPPNTVDQLRALADERVEIGAHTKSHADLGSISSYDLLSDEIVGSRDVLQQAIGCPVRYFAFPYGQRSNITDVAIQIARHAGLLGVCSAFGGYNSPRRDSFHLQRLHGDPNFLRFKNWLSFDPRMALAARTIERCRCGP